MNSSILLSMHTGINCTSKKKAFVLSFLQQDSVIDGISNWQVAQSISTLSVLFFHPGSCCWSQLFHVSFTEKVPEAEISTVRFSPGRTTGASSCFFLVSPLVNFESQALLIGQTKLLNLCLCRSQSRHYIKNYPITSPIISVMWKCDF